MSSLFLRAEQEECPNDFSSPIFLLSHFSPASSLGAFSLSADTISRAGTGLTDVDTEEVLGSFARKKSIQELQEAYGRLVLPSTTKQLAKAFFLRLENMMATIVDEPPAFNFLR